MISLVRIRSDSAAEMLRNIVFKREILEKADVPRICAIFFSFASHPLKRRGCRRQDASKKQKEFNEAFIRVWHTTCK